MGASIREDPLTATVNHTREEERKPEVRKYKSGVKTKCWFHGLEGYSGDHPIWRCKEFLSKSTKERADLATAHKACHRCLNLNCSGVEDIQKCPRGFRCSVSGCDAIHNNLLHVDRSASFHAAAGSNESSASPLLPTQTI